MHHVIVIRIFNLQTAYKIKFSVDIIYFLLGSNIRQIYDATKSLFHILENGVANGMFALAHKKRTKENISRQPVIV